MLQEDAVRETAEAWFEAMSAGDADGLYNLLASDVEWINYEPVNGFNTAMSWIGTYHGRDAVMESYAKFLNVAQVESEELIRLVVEGVDAIGIVKERSRVRQTDEEFAIEFVQHLTIKRGKIVKWKSYTDPSQIIRALHASVGDEGTSAEVRTTVIQNDMARLKGLLEAGALPDVSDARGQTPLMHACARGETEAVRLLLEAGANPNRIDTIAGAYPLHKACQGGSVEIARLLLESGAKIDSIMTSTGHTPLMDAVWYAQPELVELFLNAGAGINISTHYGFSLKDHMQYEEGVNRRRSQQMKLCRSLINDRIKENDALVESQKLMAAVVANDAAQVQRLLDAGAEVDQRAPILNSFNDAHTPLLVACRDGHEECVAALIAAGADVNAVEPTFGAVPLHKAVYNGHAGITELLCKTEGINLNYCGGTNGYTPLHDALWHGYEECARILIEAGSDLTIEGDDGKKPIDIALEIFGKTHDIVSVLNDAALTSPIK